MSGSQNECLDRYPYFAVLGAVGFIGMYIGGLHYRAQEQHRLCEKITVPNYFSDHNGFGPFIYSNTSQLTSTPYFQPFLP